ncbi:MAG: TRAP transporter substrate-binding protein, partial [Cyclobacteriaceae bacterium]
MMAEKRITDKNRFHIKLIYPLDLRLRALQTMLIGMILLFTGVSCQQPTAEVTTLRLAHALDVSHPVHQGIIHMSEQLAEISNGELIMEVYPSGQLGSERECLELLQVGSLDMTKVSAAVMENFAPVYEVLSIPYIFQNRAHAYQVLDGEIGQHFLEQGTRYRLRGLAFYDAGSRSFYTKDKPVESPADIEGLKIRVQRSKTAVRMISDMGGSPTPIAWGELYTALQQGVVDGAENNPPSFYFSRHFEVCKYYSINEHTSVPDVLVIGTSTWGRLTEKQKDWVTEAARRSAKYQRKVWRASEKDCLEKMIQQGVQVSS